MAVSLRGDFDASRLWGLAKQTKDGPQARRLLALAAIYDGSTRTEAAKIGGAGLQIIRDWVLRFNACGPDGLLNGKAPGRPSAEEATSFYFGATGGHKIKCIRNLPQVILPYANAGISRELASASQWRLASPKY